MSAAGEENARERIQRLGDTMRSGAPAAGPLTWDDIGFLVHGMAFASRPLHAATASVTKRYDLGPRGAWILNLVSIGLIYPHELAEIFKIGRSLVSAELVRLTEAGLITSRQGEGDRRRSELALTAEGQAALDRIRTDLAALVTEALAHYTPGELRLCARMLADMRMASSSAPD